MPSDYPTFEVKVDDDAGGWVTVPGAVVEVRDITNPEAIVRLLPDLVADGSGVVASGTLAVPTGSLIRFTWKDEGTGECGYAETTSV